MLPAAQLVDRSPSLPLGYRRGITDPGGSAIDLIGAPKTVGSEASAQPWAYPSPPMSGSPPLPPKAGQEASDRSRAPLSSYPAIVPQDHRPGHPIHTGSGDPRRSLPTPLSLPRTYPPERPGAASYSYRSHEEPLPRIPSFPQQQLQGSSQGPPPGPPQGPPHGHHHALPHGAASHQYLPLTGPGSLASYPSSSRQPTLEAQPYTSPKSQRKTKGHVASACVPCKRAHLRCDAQRPCSRCLSNGKEDACVDVKHKRRGRPRLRDDRDTRFDSSQFPNPQDVPLRRPLSIHPIGAAGPSGYDDPLRRTQSSRILKSQPSESRGPRYLDRASGADASMYAAQPPAGTRLAEPVAYLTMDLEFSKVSPTFLDALGGANIVGRKLTEACAAGELEKVLLIRNQLLAEQKRREPNYLPPIMGRGDQVIQGLGFSMEEVARFQLDHQEYLTLVMGDGHTRTFPLRIGLAKEGSYYFVVVGLSLPPRYAYPSPSPHARDVPSPYHAQPSPVQQPPGYVQFAHTPVSATFDPIRHRFSEGSQPRPSSGLLQSPGTPSAAYSLYPGSPGRAEYAGLSPYQMGRNDGPSAVRAPPPTGAFQLPPIRAQPERGPGEGESRRSSRVHIGGLLDNTQGPEGSR
ncbi:hypothetical protein S40288_04025 [Stachybotrys chartarum IBT 40288]|nr:hypothetical protein S40288_04025 [Stachybotrys chartarum IBT 40288]